MGSLVSGAKWVERGWVWPLCVLRVGRSPVLPLTG